MKSFGYRQRAKVAFQYLMPQLYLTQAAGWLAEQKWGGMTHRLIQLFAKKYKVNMSEAKLQQFSDYATFNQFFTRELQDGARPINQQSDVICLPADGKISQCGHIDNDLLLQAKGHYFNLSDLLAGQQDLVQTFKNGTFATTYLSPRDYHRVHMPCDGTLRKMIYVPGTLFSVNPFLAEHVPNLFAKNERVICVFDTAFGPMIQILVGATITASIRTTWAGVINPPRSREIKTWDYDGSLTLSKGEQMGAFQLGSTVINLFTENSVKLADNLDVNSITQVGGILATKA